MTQKDRSFLIFTLVLAVTIGAAATFSIPGDESHLTTYDLLKTATGETFSVQVPSAFEEDFRLMLSGGPAAISRESLGTRNYPVPPGETPYVHLATSRVKLVHPYFFRFIQGFLFVLMIFFAVRLMIRFFVVREFRHRLTVGRRKPGRKNK